MKLYANGILLNAAAQSVTLEKSRGDAAATLTAVKHRWERGLFTTELTWEGEA